MGIGLVVARYKEDVSWINEMQAINPALNIYIYNKSQTPIEHVLGPYMYEYRKNVGNEAETYLYHIVKDVNFLGNRMVDTHTIIDNTVYLNWDETYVDDITLFVQGNPFDHMNKQQMIDIISDKHEVRGFEWLSNHMLDCKVSNDCHHRGLPISEFYYDLFGNTIAGDFNFGVGGQFAVTQDTILKINPARYIQARDMVINQYSNNEPWCILERIWDQIFMA